MRLPEARAYLVGGYPRGVFPLWRAISALLVALALSMGLFGCCGERFGGRVTEVTGTARIRRAGEKQWRDLEKARKVEFGDSVRTEGESQLEIAFGKGNTIRLDESTKICVVDTVDSVNRPTIEVYNAFGTVLSDIENLDGRHARYRVRTPTSVAAIEGTFFGVSFDPHIRRSHVNVIAGHVVVWNPLLPVPPIIVPPGFLSLVLWREPPVAPVKIPPGQWKKMRRVMPPNVFALHTKRLNVKVHGPGWGLRLKPGKAHVKGRGGRGPGAKVKIRPGKGGLHIKLPKGGGTTKFGGPKGKGGGNKGSGRAGGKKRKGTGGGKGRKK